jgi:hypothetical protein
MKTGDYLCFECDHVQSQAGCCDECGAPCEVVGEPLIETLDEEGAEVLSFVFDEESYP